MAETWYLETSAINFFCDQMEEQDALATRQLQRSKGRLWLMSPVTYFEMSLTGSTDRRDQIFGFAQHLLHDELIASPEELIVGFIERGCPLVDPITSWQSAMPLADAWRRVANVSDETFDLTQKVIQHTAKVQRHLGSIAERILTSTTIDPNDWNEADHFQLIIELCRSQLPPRKRLSFIPEDIEEPLEILTIFFVFSMFCCLNTLNPFPYLKFWKEKNCSDPVSRLRWLLDHLPIIFLRGAFIEMALAAITQYRGKPTRGLIFDVLHFVYLPYVRKFLTTDGHFDGVAGLSWHPNAHKIVRVDAIELTRHERTPIQYPQPRIKT
jgi:hypothetical protein